ncbi:MAG: Bro-N domain-containing protein [Oscillospiraceae bacterium]
MNDLQIFSNPEFGSVRCIEKDGEEWFVGKDVALALGYKNPHDALFKHVDEDDKGVANCDTLGGTQKMTVINESGLYSLIILSELPSARKFKKWITSEVIPSIRKTGGYGVPQMSQSELILKIAQNNVELERRIAAAENETKAVSEKLDNALDVFTSPTSDNWKDEMNRIINRMIEENNLNYGLFRRKLYDELEQTASCDLGSRQKRLRGRMEKAGATYAERQAITKIDVISRDDKLKAIFDGIVRKYMAKYVISAE